MKEYFAKNKTHKSHSGEDQDFLTDNFYEKYSSYINYDALNYKFNGHPLQHALDGFEKTLTEAPQIAANEELEKDDEKSVKKVKLRKYQTFVIKAFQRRYRQELVNGRIDKECLLISNNLT